MKVRQDMQKLQTSSLLGLTLDAINSSRDCLALRSAFNSFLTSSNWLWRSISWLLILGHTPHGAGGATLTLAGATS